MCDYIEFYDYDVAPFLNKDQVREYFKKSNMRELSIWAMEMEIMTTAKIFRRDIYMWLIINGVVKAISGSQVKMLFTSITDR